MKITLEVYEKTIRSDIQWLRGIAVLSVIFYHAGEKYFPNGYLGVDIFFDDLFYLINHIETLIFLSFILILYYLQ